MADKQSEAKAPASSRGLTLQVLSPEETLCLLFLFLFPNGTEDLNAAAEFTLTSHPLLYKQLVEAQRRNILIGRLLNARVPAI